jgi:hypothetical protein
LHITLAFSFEGLVVGWQRLAICVSFLFSETLVVATNDFLFHLRDEVRNLLLGFLL